MFYTVIRQFIKGDNETHSMEIKTDYNAALQRYFNIIAADLADASISYNAAYIIGSDGTMLESRVFDRIGTEPTEQIEEG